MKRNSYSVLAFAAVLALGLVAGSLAIAADGRDCTAPVYTPNPNGAVISTRVFNDCPSSTVTTTNYFPAMVQIQDTDEGCVGWTNLHVWSFSDDGGLTPAVFENCSHYKFSSVFKGYASGAVAEGGLRLAPWWAQDVDGRFMVRIGGNGEIACFGGRLPFFSFTSAFGITYVPGTPIWLEISYNPHSLTAGDPATIGYQVFYNGVGYQSGALAFDMANPSEDPPHGLYGELYPARVGGFLQGPNGNGGALFDVTGNWSNIQFEGPSATAATHSTWGQLKSIYR